MTMHELSGTIICEAARDLPPIPVVKFLEVYPDANPMEIVVSYIIGVTIAVFREMADEDGGMHTAGVQVLLSQEDRS